MILPTAGQATAQKKGLHELVPAGRAKTAKGSELNGRTSVGAGGTGRGQTQTLGAFATCELLELLDRRRRSHLFVARFETGTHLRIRQHRVGGFEELI